ncbi:MoxR family ATPase [Rhodococcus sp. X156]|uniref:AAA family ATPase n=1 Tax=Rhodococcus sp. X156 TaxID=2499145 RepID=UPI000FD9D0E7|nr:MoxR family ATPase [Rhodococcus sp. X156]
MSRPRTTGGFDGAWEQELARPGSSAHGRDGAPDGSAHQTNGRHATTQSTATAQQPATQSTATQWTVSEVAETAERVVATVEQVLVGKTAVVRTAVLTLLAGGHLLLEDVPGVGKTALAKALARAVDSSVSRIQFTPDLMPSDVTGVSIYDRQNGEFEFQPGPVFANLLVADEINRASPKTQSALLECMEEQQVTVDGHTYQLAEPFMVLATQNPVEMEGTYPLPEAQRDRFTTRVSLGYPSAEAELMMIDTHSGHDAVGQLVPACSAAEVSRMIDAVRDVHVSAELRRYVVTLVSATRTSPLVRLGASPRATLHVVRAARAHAAMAGRAHVLPDDVIAVAEPVLAHRLLLSGEAVAARRDAAAVVQEIVGRTPVPRGGPAPRAAR